MTRPRAPPSQRRPRGGQHHDVLWQVTRIGTAGHIRRLHQRANAEL